MSEFELTGKTTSIPVKSGPPQVLWATCGNKTDARLKQISDQRLPIAILKLQAGDPLIEIADVLLSDCR